MNTRLLVIAMIVMAAVVVGSWAVHYGVEPPAWRMTTVVVEDLRRFSEGMALVDSNVRLAVEHANIDPETRAARIQILGERVAYQKGLTDAWQRECASIQHSIIPLADLGRLVEHAGDLLNTASMTAPPAPVAASQAASAPALSTDPRVTGVLPGVQTLVRTRAQQIREELALLERRAVLNTLNTSYYEASLGGLSPEQWILLGVSLAGGMGMVLVLAMMRRLKTSPGELVERTIRSQGRQDPRKGVDACYQHVQLILRLADELSKGAH